jgi:hypothetical protein
MGKTKEEIIKNSSPAYINLVGIYFLIHNNEIVYVGQTTKGLARTYSHINQKVFDSIYFETCDLKLLDVTEAYYITKLNPKYNITLKGYQSIKRIKSQLKKINFENNITVLKKKIKEFGIMPDYFNKRLYLSPNNYILFMQKMGVDNGNL